MSLNLLHDSPGSMRVLFDVCRGERLPPKGLMMAPNLQLLVEAALGVEAIAAAAAFTGCQPH